MKYNAIVLASGKGVRCGLNYNKILYKIDGKEIIYLSMRNFLDDDRCSKIILTYKEDDLETLKTIFKNESKVIFVKGGQTRTNSIKNALEYVNEDYVLIHDGARPYYSKDLLDRIVNNLLNNDAIIPGVEISDTIVKVSDGRLISNVNRSECKAIQTPQGFNSKLIKKAYSLASKAYTDDATLLKDILDVEVIVVDGEVNNKKITYKEDLK